MHAPEKGCRFEWLGDAGQAAVFFQGIARCVADIFRQDEIGYGKGAGGQGMQKGGASRRRGRIEINDQQINGIRGVGQGLEQRNGVPRVFRKTDAVVRLFEHEAEAVLQIGPVFREKDVVCGHAFHSVKLFCSK